MAGFRSSVLLAALTAQHAESLRPRNRPSVAVAGRAVSPETSQELRSEATRRELRSRRYRSDRSGAVVSERSAAVGCGWDFIRYEPSSWEREWVKNIDQWQGPDGPYDGRDTWTEGCKQMRRALPQLHELVRGLEAIDKHSGAKVGSVFSYYRQRGRCTGKERLMPIEPLVSFLRDPRAVCTETPLPPAERSRRCRRGHCLMFSKEFLLLPWTNQTDQGRAFFFDLGASLYNEGAGGASQKWFVDTFARRGIEFDRILAFEATPIDPAKYWSRVPPRLRPRVSFYNVPVSTNHSSGRNPFDYVKQLTTPNDYVVVKLDIDNSHLEEALVEQLVSDPELMGLVDEFVWEHHVRRHPMTWPGGWGRESLAAPKTTADSYMYFSRLRRGGVRAHSWV
eukprot:TRINITY_DN39637_c0_g1_i1.p1 TRINITY_DN39637_c0_g1~~TRINITY_DN39637_c0_g1_i1.p1  ORF type:complete len:413 (+),score=88.71 TRINITY_DN39637_c0_g1_i1:59-1240(+)